MRRKRIIQVSLLLLLFLGILIGFIMSGNNHNQSPIKPEIEKEESPFICTHENDHAPKINDEGQRYYREATKLEAIHKPDEYAVNRLYKKAMEEGHWVAQYNLGVRYMKGRGLAARDNLRAITLFEDLIAREIPLGMYAMAMMFRDGIGVAGDPTKAS